MQTFAIQSPDIEALHYNPEARLLLVKFKSGAICNFTRISAQALQRLLGPDVQIENPTAEDDASYLAGLRSGGLRALYSLTGIKPAQFDFAQVPGIW
ncbi:hypothetical protein [Rhizobium alamii]|jgi:hypothetical protein|uniref:hypothetical protein n=1 Tax=unclassified Rhizobium TaxID=2613769 RepID=UPI00055D6B17